MIKSVNNYPISQLFDIELDIVYVIPKYQREYTWSKTQWENLFDDILENDAGYFLGSIICINQSKDTHALQKLEVVDGQQRLATLSLLFAAIYDAFKNQNVELNEEQNAEVFNLKRKLVLKKGTDQIRVIPQIQNCNCDDYKAVLAKTGVISSYDQPSHAGNRKIFKSFRYFQERIRQLSNGKKNTVQGILEFLNKVSNTSLVKIEVDNHADAYILFESLNNRGMPLTAIDLIKNKLLARLESVDPGKIDLYFANWNKLLEYLGDDYGVQERFFRQYYNAFKEELKKVHQVPVATRSNLIQIYEKLINKDEKGFLQKIFEAGRLYALMLGRNQEDESLNGLEKLFQDLERIQGAPSYLLLLFLLVKRKSLKLTTSQISEAIWLLVCFFVRRNLTDTPPTRDLTRMFMNITNKLSQKTGKSVIDLIRKYLVSESASDKEFRQKLAGPIYEENVGVTRFILCALAEQGMTKETFVDLWRFENRQFVWTIEHIFPQGADIPKAWVDMIANGEKNKAKEYQELHVHKLGNLTISGFNSTLGNKSFEEKKNRKDRKGRRVGYKNGLNLNKDLVKYKKWTVENIELRTQKLVDQTIKLFKINKS